MSEKEKNSDGKERRNVLCPGGGGIVIENLMLWDSTLTPQIERIRRSFSKAILPKRVLLDDPEKK